MVLTVRYILKSFKVLFPALLRKWNGKETQRSKSFLEEILSRWPVHTPKRARGNFEALQKHLEAGKAFKVFIWYHRSGIQTEVVLLPSLLAPFQNRMVPSRVPVSLFRISPTQKNSSECFPCSLLRHWLGLAHPPGPSSLLCQRLSKDSWSNPAPWWHGSGQVWGFKAEHILHNDSATLERCLQHRLLHSR